MRFSIVVSVYNVEKYLEMCIESVLAQTFNNFEIILVDDGSTDDSTVICNRYAKEYSNKIKVIHIENIGLLNNRQIGFRNANGEYILFIDSDDTIRNDTLEILDCIINNKESDLIIYNFSKKSDYSTKGIKHTFTPNEYIDKKVMYDRALNSTDINQIWSKCIKREIIDAESDYSHYKHYNVAEDIIHSLPVIDKCEKPYYLDEALYYYRTNLESITNSYNNKRFDSLVLAFKKLFEYSEKWNVEYIPDVLYSPIITLIKSKEPLKEKIKELKRILNDDYFKYIYKIGNKDCMTKKTRIIITICVFLNKMRLI